MMMMMMMMSTIAITIIVMTTTTTNESKDQMQHVSTYLTTTSITVSDNPVKMSSNKHGTTTMYFVFVMRLVTEEQ